MIQTAMSVETEDWEKDTESEKQIKRRNAVDRLRLSSKTETAYTEIEYMLLTSLFSALFTDIQQSSDSYNIDTYSSAYFAESAVFSLSSHTVIVTSHFTSSAV